MTKRIQDLVYPEAHEEVFTDTPEELTGYIAPDEEGTWTVFFTYEGPEDRFIFGVHKRVSMEKAIRIFEAEKARRHARTV